jgi:D-alanyl-D-alanine carboxypeptidase/D-alanyl-D-alanine-endopeptidase (penicillin-binding protein 4)
LNAELAEPAEKALGIFSAGSALSALSVAFGIALSVAACATTSRRALPASPAPPAAPALAQLQRDVDEILAQPLLGHGFWGVLVKSLNTDDTLYAVNAGTLMMPASNMKVVTLAAAAERLGWDYRYDTRFVAGGPVAAGVLDGDLIVVGSGDPSLVAADGAADRVFGDIAERMKQLGIRTIAGRIVGDDRALDDQMLGFGWSWDDLADDYAAGVSALQFNENAVRATVAPGPAAGNSAAVSLSSSGSGLTIVNAVTTGAPGSPPAITAHRLPGRTRLEFRGSIPLDAAASNLTVSVDNPTLFFVTAFRNALIAHGIDVRGPAVDVDEVNNERAPAGASPLLSYQSAPLSTLALRLMKASQNQYAETFLKTMGAAAGTPTAAGGRTVAQTILERWGVPAGALIQRDGSGLSRYDYVTPEALVTILTHIDRDERLRGPFEASLPIAGRDGSLSNRMKGTPAEGNARAKTGSMSNVRALSGYVTTADGEPLAFAIIANNFEVPADAITGATDAIVVRLATFRR